MDIFPNPDSMTLDELFAEITDLAQKQGRMDCAVLIAKVDIEKQLRYADFLASRLTALFDEIRRRVSQLDTLQSK